MANSEIKKFVAEYIDSQSTTRLIDAIDRSELYVPLTKEEASQKIEEWVVLKREHRWAMNELKKETAKRIKAEAKIPLVFLTAYFLGVIVMFVVGKISGV